MSITCRPFGLGRTCPPGIGFGRKAHRLGVFCSFLWAGPTILACLAGCADPPPAVTSNQVLTIEESEQKRLFEEEDQARVLAAMRSVAADYRSVDPPAAAIDGVRFSDLSSAVSYACQDVEMAVIETVTIEEDYRVRFKLRTIEDWPGELIVHRAPGPEVYEAEAWVGRFPDEPKCIARRDALLQALHQRMLAFGAKRAFSKPKE